MIFFKSAFKKPIICHVYDKVSGWRKYKTCIEYDKRDKMWFLKLEHEKIPVGEYIFDLTFNGELIVKRTGPNTYEFLDIRELDKKQSIETLVVPPSELYSAMVKAQARFERMRGTMEKLLPIVMVSIVVIIIGIFIAIVWSSVGDNMVKISENFKVAMASLEEAMKYRNATAPPIPAR